MSKQNAVENLTLNALRPQQSHTQIDADNPWPGLDFFTEDAARFFNGRDKESTELLARVQDAPLTVLFGRSGLGKTSLLQAGLFPKLRKNKIQPIYIRLDFSKGAPSPIAQVVQRFKAELSKQDIEAPEFTPNETLWEYLHRRELELWSKDNWQITPLLVFDQFEEIHTLTSRLDSDAIHHFKVFLADLIENRIPADLNKQLESDTINYHKFAFRSQRLKILLSFREDFLANFENWKRDIPSLIHNRVRLEPMNYQQAIDAVYETGKAKKLVSKDIAAKIVHLVEQNTTDITKISTDFSDDSIKSVATIEPTILSLICHGLNETRKQKKKKTIDTSLLKEKESQPKVIIEEFYNRVLQDLSDIDNIKKFIETELITTQGYRKRCSKDDAISKGITEKTLLSLENHRLLHQISQDKVNWYELTHDLLTDVVIRSRKKREIADEKQRHEQEVIEREQKILLEERARSADHFRLLSEERARTAKRLKVLAMGLVFLLIYASYQTYQADRAAKEAELQSEIAKKQTAIAKEKEAQAQNARILAEAERKFAEEQTARLKNAMDRQQELSKEIKQNLQKITVEKNKVVEQRKRAEENRRVALEAEARATRSATLATEKAHLSRSKELALSAVSAYTSNPGTGFRLAEAAVQEQPNFLARNILWRYYSRPWYTSSFTSNNQADSIVISPYGNQFATFGRSSEINIGNYSTGKSLITLKGHRNWISSVAFSSDGNQLLTASRDNTAKLWDLSTGNNLLTLSGHNERLVYACFSPDDQRILTLSTDNTMRLWDAVTGQNSLTIDNVPPAISGAFSKDGSKLYIGFRDNTIRKYDSHTGNETTTTQLNDYSINDIAFSPDGKHFVTTSRDDHAPRLWRMRSMKFDKLLSGHTQLVTSVAFSTDSNFIVSASRDNSVRVWDVDSGEELTTIEGDAEWFNAAAITPDADVLITSANNNTTNVWRKQTDLSRRTYHGHKDIVNTAVFSPNAQQILSASDDQTLKIFDVDSNRLVRTISGSNASITAATFSADGKWIASASKNNVVGIWDSATGVSVANLSQHKGAVNYVEFSADDQRLISASADKSAIIWDLSTFKPMQTLRSAIGGDIKVASFSPASKALFTVSEADTVEILRWDNFQSFKDIAPSFAGKIVNAGAFSTDGKYIVTGLSNNTAQVWNSATKEILTSLVGHTNWIVASAFSPQGDKIATASNDNTIMLWETQTGQSLATLTGHIEPVTSVSFSNDGDWLVSSSVDTTVRVWPANYKVVLDLINQKHVRGKVHQLTAKEKTLYGFDQ